MKHRTWMVPVLVAGALLVTNVAEAKVIVIPPRAGQIGIGIGGQYGSLTSGGGFGTDFGSGGGLGVRMRYRLRYERAFGINFERQDFETRHASDADTSEKRLTLMNTSLEFYQLFGTRGRTTRMLSAGVGLTQASKKLKDGEAKLGGDDVRDGLFISVGAGIERFFYQSLGLDLNLHYQAIFQNGSTNNDIQASAGLIFYASY